MASCTTGINEVTIFGRLLDSGDKALPPPAARYILALEFLPDERRRMHQLALKAQAGALSPAEEEEIQSYERVGHLLSIWKSKARQALKQSRRVAR
jgi:hypothetical protein